MVMGKIKEKLVQAVFLAAVIVSWQLISVILEVPEYLFPSPYDIILAFQKYSHILFNNALLTLLEAFIGFFIAFVIGSLLALAIVKSRFLDRTVYPFIVLTQTTPKLAIAPLFIIWFGFALVSKVVVAALVAFFPIVINTVKGLKSVDRELVELFRSYGASKFDTLIRLQIPASLPHVFSGLQLAATMSVLGAVIGEFVGADKGLGYIILQSNVNLETSLMFATLLVLAAIGFFFYSAIGLIEKRLLFWHDSQKNGKF